MWFHYTASSSGEVRIHTCELADFDTKIAVYDGCDTCPPTEELLIECNDIGGGCADSGAEVIFNGVGGNCYLVRVGGGYLDPAGSGTLFIEGSGPPCPWDLNDDGTVGVGDLLALFAAWGPCPPDPCAAGPPSCPGDFDLNGFVGVGDLLAMFANWGPCP